MAGPWEQFSPQATADGPWSQFKPAEAERGVMDKLLGTTGPRYQTWPEKLVRGVVAGAKSAATLPGDVLKEATQPAPAQISDSDVSVLSVPRTLDFATLATPVNPAVRAGDKAIPGVTKALQADKPVVPTARELADTGAADINAARSSGLEVTASSVGDYSRKLQQELFDSGIHPVDAPSTFAKLKELESAPADAFFTPGGLQSLRESLGATAQNFNPAAAKDQLAASRAIKGFDQFLPSLAEKDVLAGTPAATQKLFETGRGNYAAAKRANSLTGELDRATTGLLERAEARAQAANSGRNIDNTIRSKIVSLLEKPKEVSGLSDDEIAALNQAAAGGPVRNTARYIGNMLGGGGGLGQTLMAGAGAAGGAAATGGNPLGALAGAAIPGALGATSKAIANQLAKRSVRGVDEMIRMRSPLYRQRVANPTMSVVSPDKRAAILRMLMTNQEQDMR